MKDNQWVQHVSGQGEKWEVYQQDAHAWAVKDPHGSPLHWLPKSEYRLCSPPEVWVDVTGECEILAIGEIKHKGNHTMPRDGYRRRLVNVNFIGGGEPNGCRKGVAIIIERKQ